MDKIQDILSEKIKPKEKVNKITQLIIEEPDYINNLILNFKQGTDVEKGTYATVLKKVSAINPDIVEPFIIDLFEYINYKANRVKWGIPETIGNLAEKYPKEVEKAIPYLMLNTGDKSTVVRWCAAYALSNIALYNLDKREELLKEIHNILVEEKNNGVKNVYLKALKQIGESN
jgi:hypothetical protein